MRNVKIIVGLAILFLIGSAGWQIGACELANIELHDDMKDMASQLGGRIGLTSFSSDEDFRNDVLRKALKYDIPLAPEQVTVQRTGEGLESRIYLAADYTVPIHLPGLSFQIHFTPESGKKPG
jgi:hypothetical protein